MDSRTSKSSHNRNTKLIVLTLSGRPDPSVAISACRAGATGVLDLTCAEKELQGEARQALAKLARYGRGRFGVKLDPDDAEFIAGISSDPPNDLRLVVLSWAGRDALEEAVRIFRRTPARIVLECTNTQEAEIGESVGMDGIIAKGYEAGGRVGRETTFILLQRVLKRVTCPVFAQGGIGLHTAAACHAAGAAGVILDSQLSLTRESPIPRRVKDIIGRLGSRDTVCLGEELGETYRVCARLGSPVIEELQQAAAAIRKSQVPGDESVRLWRDTVRRRVGWESVEKHLFLVGQDVAFASAYGERFGTTAGVLDAINRTIGPACRACAKTQPLREGAPLAIAHGTRYPIVQGPMARISDTPSFAEAVAQKGALPFVAAAQMDPRQLEVLLKQTGVLLKDKSWGVGLLGFLPADLYNEHAKVVIQHHPPFALIAGGRPEQVKRLELEGIQTYVHVPSPGLLKMFVDAGIRKFIFEGREAGGHVGPLCSFVLWEEAIEILLNHQGLPGFLEECHVLFAGGIHDAVSASMVAVMGSALAEQGAKIGVQLGSAYLLTKEVIECGAMVQAYQDEVIACDQTVVLDSGFGHAVRCTDSPFAKSFAAERLRLVDEGRSAAEIRDTLESMNVGRLRIASKGLTRGPEDAGKGLAALDDDAQHRQGLYMIGQVAGLREQPFAIDTLHHDISVNGSERISALCEKEGPGSIERHKEPSDIALIGMACLFPKASNLKRYWENILNKVDAITAVPEGRWDSELYYSEDLQAKDKTYSKWGAFLDGVPFDPVRYGMPPTSVPSVEPLQLLALETATRALEDAGYSKRPFARERTSVILGISGTGELGQTFGFRSMLPALLGDCAPGVLERFNEALPEWTEDTFPGILMNVAAGRIANRLDLGGTNFTVDAACASSLAAVYIGIRELENHSSDMVVVGAADCMQNPFTYLCFARTQALSPRGRCQTFDEDSDGIVLGEGVGMVVLKRLDDAERDGDRIYAVIKGVGASSDGRDKSLTAPRVEGQVRAFERAYAQAGFSPGTVGLIEAHGTGTVVGDQVEIEALCRVFTDARSERQSCVIGSVKSMIGHTKSAAGLASLIKAGLALHHKVLPPTLGVDTPNPALRSPECPFFANCETRPWIHSTKKHPRRAGASALGFGGTNFHVVLEEYTEDFLNEARDTSFQEWPSELFVWEGDSRDALLQTIGPIEEAIRLENPPALRDLAYTVCQAWEHDVSRKNAPALRLAVVASSIGDLKEKLSLARQGLSGQDLQIQDPRGIYFADRPLARQGKVAFLFPGQGSQYPHMLADLLIQFPELRAVFEKSDLILEGRLSKPLSGIVFPPSAFSEEERQGSLRALAQTRIAQPAVGTANAAVLNLLRFFGIEPDMVAGHSYGEYVALFASGAFTYEDLVTLSEARGRIIVEGAGPEPGAMAAVNEAADAVSGMIEDLDGIWLANLNAPKQTVISGTRSAIEKAVKGFEESGIRARIIPVACAFHSPIVSGAVDRLRERLSEIEFRPPRLTVFSNTTGRPYPTEPEAIAEQLVRHVTNRVDFIKEIDAMYEAGARIFVEVGPGRVLTGLAGQILGDRPHLTVASNQKGRSGLVQVQHLLAQLTVQGVPVRLGRLYRGRELKRVNLDALQEGADEGSVSPTTWLVNGARARLWNDASLIDQGIKPIELPYAREDTVPASVDARVPLFDPSIGQPVESLCPSSQEDTQVMLQYQRLMQRFVNTQRDVMMRYLQRSGKGRPVADEVSHRPGPAAGEAASASRREPISSLDQETGPGAPPAAHDKSPLNREQRTAQLIDVVSERTGYPPDMLGLDLDLEGDLGIDSIKRVEILGSFTKLIFPPEAGGPPTDVEKLTSARTLRQVIDLLEKDAEGMSSHGRRQEVAARPPASGSEPEQDVSGEETVPRFTVTAVPAPPAQGGMPISADRVLVITDDGRGIAQTLTQSLKEKGHQVALIRYGEKLDQRTEDCYGLAACSAEAIGSLIETLREEHGPVGGLIHLLPLKPWILCQEMDMAAWKDRLRLEVETLFHLLKLLEEDLAAAAKEGGACVLGVTGMGGDFAGGTRLPEKGFFPGQGAVAGLLKTVAEEWPEIRVKAVDLNLEGRPSELAEHVLAELDADEDFVEVGYDGSGRRRLELIRAPLTDGTETVLDVDSSWVIVLTGGARGITAEVALELARRHAPTLILVGRSPLPAAEESVDTEGLTKPQDLKSALIAGMRRHGSDFTLADVESAYKRLCHERDMRANMSALQRAGATVEYFQADVRDEDAFGGLIDNIYERYGRIDGFIHGAGIIEDKLFKDKTWASFDRVFGTKVESAFVLYRKLRRESLKFLALFSSVAGRWGNRGQCDYTAANEVLNKLSIHMDKAWPGRVLSVIWGPWQMGMASAELQKQFLQRGVHPIPPRPGSRTFAIEIQKGKKGDVEVVLGRGPWEKTALPQSSRKHRGRSPLLDCGLISTRRHEGFFEIVKCLDCRQDLYLEDHRLDGRWVLPAAMAVELMAETAQLAWPDRHVTALENVRVLKGIVQEDGANNILLSAGKNGEASSRQNSFELDVEVRDAGKPERLFYSATVILERQVKEGPRQDISDGKRMRSFSMSPREAYRKWLFHGPRFQCIKSIEGISEEGMLATLVRSCPKDCLAGKSGGHWVLDPVILDSGPQLAILWARTHLDMTPLPSRFKAIRLFRWADSPEIRCFLKVLDGSGKPSILADVFFLDPSGHVVAMIEGLEATGSESLNRLAGASSTEHGQEVR